MSRTVCSIVVFAEGDMGGGRVVVLCFIKLFMINVVFLIDGENRIFLCCSDLEAQA